VTDQPELTVVHDADRQRYALRRGPDVLGSATYHWDQGRVVLDHTGIDPARREKGLGAILARGTLDDLRARGLRVIPQCPFMAAFIRRNPEYQDLVDEAPAEV
jgi:hypothetical protein